MRYLTAAAAIVTCAFLTPSALAAETDSTAGQLFVRDAFSDSRLAGYRWSGGFSLAGRISQADRTLSTVTVEERHVDIVFGQRFTLHGDDDWHSFWDLDLALGRSTIDAGGSSETLSRLGVGGYLGAEVHLASRLLLGGRVGLEYRKDEVSASRTDTGIDIGVVNVELTWQW